MTESNEPKYAYSFFPCFSKVRGLNETSTSLLCSWKPRLEMVFTESEYAKFVGLLKEDGITLAEVERVPYHKPESVV